MVKIFGKANWWPFKPALSKEDKSLDDSTTIVTTVVTTTTTTTTTTKNGSSTITKKNPKQLQPRNKINNIENFIESFYFAK